MLLSNDPNPWIAQTRKIIEGLLRTIIHEDNLKFVKGLAQYAFYCRRQPSKAIVEWNDYAD